MIVTLTRGLAAVVALGLFVVVRLAVAPAARNRLMSCMQKRKTRAHWRFMPAARLHPGTLAPMRLESFIPG